ncbi:protein draper-like [Crassostrea angulata]|uniref:protein draper-like n=1 Tax=Magallana angulata TaxID=2784310 RepID=UPI0022B159C3|nr:protein draper-like [Crassostrea angulata]
MACIGFWGKECRNICSYGYYGHGCRRLCKCNYQQICDPIKGCIADNSVDESSNLTNCSDMEKVYNILTSAHGINICYNSMTAKIECCAGFTNKTGICEKNIEKVEYTTNNAEEELFGGYAIMTICVLSAPLGSTWLIVAVLVIYKNRRGNWLETQSFTRNYEDAQFTDAWDMYTELGNPYQGIHDTTYEQPKM